MAAYVEIVFDNSDGRLSVESDEVILRRTVGHKKDEFFLNRKRIQKQEVMSLLESAGFSKSNPYYIVQQGKVSNLCVMKDADRLNLLKEVAGTTIYEERRAESLKIMQDTANKQEKVTVRILLFLSYLTLSYLVLQCSYDMYQSFTRFLIIFCLVYFLFLGYLPWAYYLIEPMVIYRKCLSLLRNDCKN